MVPTFHSKLGHPPDVLDMALSGNATVVDITTIEDLTSDHNPVLMHVTGDLQIHQQRLIKKTDWNQFTENMEAANHKLPIINTIDQLEDAVDSLTNKILSCIEKATKSITPHAINPLALPLELRVMV